MNKVPVRAKNRQRGYIHQALLLGLGGADGGNDFSAVRYFLRGQGTNGQTTFTDSSEYNRTVTRGGGAIHSDAQVKFLDTSILFDGSGDYLSTGSLSLSLPFTIRAWMYPLTGGSSTIGFFDGGPSTTQILRNFEAGRIAKQGSSFITFDPPANAWSWNHIVFEAFEGNLRATYHRGGTQISQGNLETGLTTFNQGATFVVGAINNGGDGSYNGYISEFQVVDGALDGTVVPSEALPTS